MFLGDLLTPGFEFIWRDLPKDQSIPENLREFSFSSFRKTKIPWDELQSKIFSSPGESFTRLLEVLEQTPFDEKELSKCFKSFHKDHMKGCEFKDFMKLLRHLLSGLKVFL